MEKKKPSIYEIEQLIAQQATEHTIHGGAFFNKEDYVKLCEVVYSLANNEANVHGSVATDVDSSTKD